MASNPDIGDGPSHAAPTQPERRRVNVYGVIACQSDSLTFGSRDPDGMSYPLYLGRLLSQKHGQTWVAVNFGAPGNCVDGIHLTQAGNRWVADRFAAAIEARR